MTAPQGSGSNRDHIQINRREIFPEDSSTHIASAYEPWLKSGETDPDGIWSVLINAMIIFWGSIEALERSVIMTRSLALQSDVLNKDGKATTPHNLKRVFWRDLPFFGVSFQEDIFATLEEDVTEDNRSQKDWDVEVTTYTHGNLFAALYIRDSEHLAITEVSQFIHLGMCSISRALEVGITTDAGIRRTELSVPAAANWILLLGHRIYAFSKENRSSTGESAMEMWLGFPHVHSFLWKGTDGYNLGRWGFWKRRFGEIARLDGGKEWVKILASQAGEEMGRIEMMDAA